MKPETDQPNFRVNEQLYLEVFKTRDDCFAVQRTDGAYAPLNIEVEERHVQEHLEGELTYGQYLVNPDGNTVKFACIDNDIDDDVPLSNALDAALAQRDHVTSLGLDSRQVWIEFSGRRGYHTWFFFEEPVPAVEAKLLLEELERRLEEADEPAPEGETIVGGHTEVFPKQIAVEEGGYGNLVKTPLGRHQKTGNRMVFVDDDGEPLADQGAVLRAIIRNSISRDELEAILDEVGHTEEAIEQQVEQKESELNLDPTETVNEELDIRPCIRAAANGECGQLTGEAGHNMRFAMAVELLSNGFTVAEAMKVYEQFDNYDPQLTRSKLEEIKNGTYNPWRCSTLKEKCGSCAADCPCPYSGEMDALASMELNWERHADQWG